MKDRQEAITVWNHGIIQVRVPLPMSLKWVNSYLIPELSGGKAYTLVDPGLHAEGTAAFWKGILEQLDISLGDIHRILLTHQHPDHYGMAGWFQQQSGAPVLISELSHRYATRLWGSENSFPEQLGALYRLHGMPEELIAQLGPHLDSFRLLVSPQPEVSWLKAGEVLQMAGLSWEAIHTPGHANGHLVFYCRTEELMLCGDQVLADITPNVSVVPGESPNPLHDFLESLRLLQHYRVQLAFPGHREPIRGWGERIEALIAHHGRRLDQIREMLDEGERTGYEICGQMFGSRISGNIHNLRFAMSESLAHLYYLEQQGRAVRGQAGGICVYR